jgi:3-oxoacyl-[acyl-carrier protein] reductase
MMLNASASERATVGAHLGLAGRVAVVTGAASGIGGAVAEMFAGYGVAVNATDVNEPGLETLKTIIADPQSHQFTVADLSRADECEAVVGRALSGFGRLDILVNVAGILHRREIDDVDEAEWDQTLDTNLKSQFFMCRAAMRPMREARWGRIVNFSSVGAHTGGNYSKDQVSSTPYIASKGGVLALTKSLAKQLARFNICVNAVAPGNVDTPLMRPGLTEAGLQAMGTRNPLGRLGAVEEMAWGAVFLASELSGYITGHTLDINGGANAR